MRHALDASGTGDRRTQATFQALVDAVLPAGASPACAAPAEQAVATGSPCIDQYIIWELEHSVPIREKRQLALIHSSLAKATAALLDAGAMQLIETGQAECMAAGVSSFLDGGPFAALTRVDRLRAMTLLEQLNLDLQELPLPFRNNPAYIRNVVSALNQLTLFGYYSEWSAYGTTRLYPPDDRRLACFPCSWREVGYPGPAYGYRELPGFSLADWHRKEGR